MQIKYSEKSNLIANNVGYEKMNRSGNVYLNGFPTKFEKTNYEDLGKIRKTNSPDESNFLDISTNYSHNGLFIKTATLD